jgi:hypothetical protein
MRIAVDDPKSPTVRYPLTPFVVTIVVTIVVAAVAYVAQYHWGLAFILIKVFSRAADKVDTTGGAREHVLPLRVEAPARGRGRRLRAMARASEVAQVVQVKEPVAEDAPEEVRREGKKDGGHACKSYRRTVRVCTTVQY